MAPSRSITSASVASLPLFSIKNGTNKVLNLTSVFLPQNGFRSRFSSSGLKWKLERRENRVVVRCEAAVAEKEAPQGPGGETYEYQAEAASKNSPDSTDATRAVDLLYDTALISSGFSPDSPAELGNKIYEMMAIALGGRWGRLEEDGETDASKENLSESDASSIETPETEVVEPSEVRTDSDPWSAR